MNSNGRENFSKKKHLWDREPSLMETAKKTRIECFIDRQSPQPAGLHNGDTQNKKIVPNLSNRQLKVSLWGPADQLTMSLGKTDVWDRRIHNDLYKPLPLAEIKKGAFSEVNDDKKPHAGWGENHRCYMNTEGKLVDPYSAWSAYPFPCPKPVGQIILKSPDFLDIKQPDAYTSCHNGVTEVQLIKEKTKGNINYLVMMPENIIAIKGNYRNLRQQISLRLYRHTDTIRYYDKKENYNYEKEAEFNQPFESPESGQEGEFFWIKQQFPAEKTFPDGFKYIMMGYIPGVTKEIRNVDGVKNLGTKPTSDMNRKPGGLKPDYSQIRKASGSAATAVLSYQENLEFSAFFTVVTSNDADNLLEEAKRRLLKAEREGMEGLISRNARWYQDFYNKRENGRIFSGRSEDIKRYLPAIYRSWSCRQTQSTDPDPYNFEADAWAYSVLEQDESPWHGLSCYNELFFTSESVANRSERVYTYLKMANYWMEAARQNAKQSFNIDGMLFAHGYFPPVISDRYIYTIATFELAMCTPGMVLKTLWDCWDYGGDMELLKEKVYPPMRETANFCSAYVKKEEDGYYHIEPTIAQERWGLTYRFKYNRDATASLAMVKWLLKRAAEAADILNVDRELKQRWLDISNCIAPYPRVMTEEGPVYAAVPGDNDPSDRHDGHLMPVNVADDINLDSPRAEIEVALRTARLTPRRDERMVFHLLGEENDYLYSYFPKNNSWFFFHSSQKDAWQRGEELSEAIKLDNRIKKMDAFWQEPERLLNSRSGWIHLFPCVPQDTTVAFRGFQARRGFLVSAEMINNKCVFVKITSRRNIDCRFINPWGNSDISIISELSGKEIGYVGYENSKKIIFKAEEGKTYLVNKR